MGVNADAANKSVKSGTHRGMRGDSPICHNACEGIAQDMAQFDVVYRFIVEPEGPADLPRDLELFIPVDVAESNVCRNRAWKRGSQRFADESGLMIAMCPRVTRLRQRIARIGWNWSDFHSNRSPKAHSDLGREGDVPDAQDGGFRKLRQSQSGRCTLSRIRGPLLDIAPGPQSRLRRSRYSQWWLPPGFQTSEERKSLYLNNSLRWMNSLGKRS